MLVQLHCNLYTICLLLGMLHKNILDKDAQIIDNGKLDTIPLACLRALNKTIEAASGQLSATVGKSLDKAEFSLRSNMTFLKHWVALVATVAKTALASAVQSCANEIYSVSQQLETTIPRWEGYITDASFNDFLAQSQCLKPPAATKELSLRLSNLLADSENAFSTLSLQPSFRLHEASQAACEMSSLALESHKKFNVISLAVGLVVNGSKTATAQSAARKIKELAGGIDNFRLPHSLSRMVLVIERGDVSASSSTAKKEEPMDTEKSARKKHMDKFKKNRKDKDHKDKKVSKHKKDKDKKDKKVKTDKSRSARGATKDKASKRSATDHLKAKGKLARPVVKDDSDSDESSRCDAASATSDDDSTSD
jgi:hypothetical protein